LDTARRKNVSSERLNTCEITSDTVVEIVAAGREHVFDIEVERTENFIANGLVSHNTRWHLDDPCGRWLEHFPQTKVLRYSAIAEQDEPHRKAGIPLFPEFKSLEFLEARRRVLTTAGWESIYQQKPIASGGDMFPVERFNIIASINRSQVKRSIRYVDKAGTADGGSYTAAALVHEMKDGTTVVEDMIRGQWSALVRDQRIMQAAIADDAVCQRYQIWFEQEPGSGGKESAEDSARKFKEFSVHLDKVTGSKEIRAEPYAAQVQAGQVSLVGGEWNRAFLEEHEQFPVGKFKDQVDATAGAYNKLLATHGSFDRSLDWVG
jgi:predicted phage terminase large subunit-like protein